MQAKRWQEIDRLFDAALALEPSERGLFLTEACAGDEELRREVESLLVAHQRAEKFIEVPAMEVAAKAAAAHNNYYSAIGRKVGPYSVLSLLGVGGSADGDSRCSPHRLPSLFTAGAF